MRIDNGWEWAFSRWHDEVRSDCASIGPHSITTIGDRSRVRNVINFYAAAILDGGLPNVERSVFVIGPVRRELVGTFLGKGKKKEENGEICQAFHQSGRLAQRLPPRSSFLRKLDLSLRYDP
jgi:hypothetical protein